MSYPNSIQEIQNTSQTGGTLRLSGCAPTFPQLTFLVHKRFYVVPFLWNCRIETVSIHGSSLINLCTGIMGGEFVLHIMSATKDIIFRMFSTASIKIYHHYIF
jgi:hypothetical protein